MTLSESVEHALAAIDASADVVAASRRRALMSRQRISGNIDQLEAGCVAIGLEGGGVIYARGRRRPIAGGATSESDGEAEDAIARRRLETMRAKLKLSKLPELVSRRAWYSDGAGLPCLGCDEVIARSDVQVKVVFASAVSMRLHAACFVVWRNAVEHAIQM